MLQALTPALTNNCIRGAIVADLSVNVHSESIQARFWARVERRGPDECWRWTGGKGSGTKNGFYGRMSISHAKSRPAHQISWEIANGAPFPLGKNACHSCDNPWCVNPAHIWVGTQSENIRDAVTKGRHWSPKKTHCKYGHALTDENRRQTSQGWSRCLTCVRITDQKWQARRRATERDKNG